MGVQVMRSRLEPMKKVARMLRRHRPLLFELVSRPRGDCGRRRRGLQQQSKTDHEKGVWLSSLSLRGNRPVPYVGSVAGTGNYPQILLKTRFMIDSISR
jgi:hypothetical protein